MRLETERLVLRDWREEDRAPMYAHVNSRADVMRWLGGPQDRAKTNAMIDTFIGWQRQYGHTFWAVERKEDGALLGFCGLKRINRECIPDCGTPEIGWRLRADAWGKGYAKEAAIASLAFGFDEQGFDFITALTLPGNEASWGLMERLGMTRREDLDFYDAEEWGPKVGTEIVYRMTRADWEARRDALRA